MLHFLSVLNADDDDVYDPEAMATVRSLITSLEPRSLYVFHMIRRWDRVVELIPPKGCREVREKLIGTPCGVYPRPADGLPMPSWHGKYGGDASFYVELLRR